MADDEVLFDDVYELCEMIGKWVEVGMFTCYLSHAGKLVSCQDFKGQGAVKLTKRQAMRRQA